MKYFTDDSVEEGDGVIIIKGRKEIRLYSNPVQAPIQDEADKVKREDIKRFIRKKEEKGNASGIKV